MIRTDSVLRIIKSIALPGILSLMLGCAGVPTIDQVNADVYRDRLQPPLSNSDRQSLSQQLQLSHALIMGASRSPMLHAEREQWRAAVEKEPQAVSLEDPMVMAGKRLANVGPMMDLQAWRAGVTQTIPWWQKLSSQGNIAATESDMAAIRYEAALRDLVIEIKDSYYELCYLDQALAITEQIESLLKNEALLAYQELTVGRTQLHEAFRAESWSAQLAYDRILLSEQRAAQAERMKALLNLPPDTTIGPVQTCPLYVVSDLIDPLYQRAEDYSSVLKIRGLEIVRAGYERFLAQLSRIPDINLGFDFMKMPGDPDAWAGLFAMNLPIWEQRNQALIREKKAMEQAAWYEALQDTNQVRQVVTQTYFAVQLTRRLADLYADTLLPQSESVMHQAELFFRNGQASFSNLIESTLAFHNFQLAYHRALADHGQAIGRLEQVVGTTVEAASPEEGPQK